ncbi:phosphatidylglycerophosphatase A [Actibacterium sp. XHP0104]|uniref:phosphatidylglycerophosphatase A family protein n=1 Tax=Actibacterium sp. XHP0104 TaxID=2984335 RepID=UPI0021E97EF9|nr:phosphatidylglycerophosphatase A [Actibacterium sp. XHP0104]MCV2881045.1 phosphatidylglycerophosphatase A [Actibacterium sp. XHP0104]
MTRIIATFFGAGLLKPAPGTWGSLAALPAAYGVLVLGGWQLLALATIAVFFIGWWATARETAGKDDHDPSEIVIDEVAGQWIALMPVAYGAAMMGADLMALYPGWIAAFLGFRLFDIWKPFPVSWADAKHTPWGVMLDDVFAGVMAALLVILLAAVAHLWLM